MRFQAEMAKAGPEDGDVSFALRSPVHFNRKNRQPGAYSAFRIDRRILLISEGWCRGVYS